MTYYLGPTSWSVLFLPPQIHRWPDIFHRSFRLYYDEGRNTRETLYFGESFGESFGEWYLLY